MRTSGRKKLNIYIKTLSVSFICALFSTGCATSSFMQQRSNDAKDIFTVTVGIGSGIKGKAGPLHLALFENSDIAGIRAGQWFANGSDLFKNDEIYAPVPIRAFDRKTWQTWFGAERFSHGSMSVSNRRGKSINAVSPGPFISLPDDTESYSQIELAAGLGISFRAGINPGELLDFLLGWFGIDIYNDDELEEITDIEMPTPFIKRETGDRGRNQRGLHGTRRTGRYR